VDEKLESEEGMACLAEMKKSNPPTKSPLMKILQDTMKKPNEEDPEEEGRDPDNLALDSIGCTANVLLVDHDKKKIFVANAGDSRCIMWVGGKCVPLSFDHKPECEIERARIYAAGSVVEEGRVDGNLNLTRAFGDLKYKQKK
jgi:serine/threonine protein phosphatase PrpC